MTLWGPVWFLMKVPAMRGSAIADKFQVPKSKIQIKLKIQKIRNARKK